MDAVEMSSLHNLAEKVMARRQLVELD